MNLDNRIKFFPISAFSIILGLTGLTIAFQKAEEIFAFPYRLDYALVTVTIIFFLLIGLIYLIKYIRYPEEVKVDFENPIRLSFFPTISISLLLLSIAFLGIHMPTSKVLWTIGTVVHTFFTYKIIGIWMMHPKFEIKHINPAWFIPVVGNILIPVAGVVHYNPEISWFFFSIGLIFWVVLFTVFMYRMVFHHPMPEKLMPTLAILIAPPAVGFIAYVKLTGQIDSFAKVMYYFALFLMTFLLTHFNMLTKIKFYLSWWAYSFPISSMAIASMLMYSRTHMAFYQYVSYALIALLVIVVLLLIPRTAKAISKGEICIEED
ncbi:MAG: SLAC1 anion channel family protein [Clostridiales bacterium]|nr:SLAC1 anion channel family protein [Clostridiales bacterium]